MDQNALAPKKIQKTRFRKALLDVYRSYSELSIFVRDAIDKNLEEIAGSGEGLEIVAFKLLEWADAKRCLTELYACFYENHPNHRSALTPVFRGIPVAINRKAFGSFLALGSSLVLLVSITVSIQGRKPDKLEVSGDGEQSVLVGDSVLLNFQSANGKVSTKIDQAEENLVSDEVLAELIQVHQHRADMVRLELSSMKEYKPVKVYLDRFDNLHGQHIDALRKGDLILASTILQSIYVLSRNLDRDGFWDRPKTEQAETKNRPPKVRRPDIRPMMLPPPFPFLS